MSNKRGRVASSISKGKTEADIVVVGGGGAGLAAAIAAAEKGCKNIIVLEKRGIPGGNSGTGGGPFAVGSPVQERLGIKVSRDELFKSAMSWTHWRTDPRIIRAFIDKSGDTIGWLEEKGLRFHPLLFNPVYHVPEGEGTGMIKVMRKSAEDLGVEILLLTPAKSISRDAKGNIAGVLAESKAGPLMIRSTVVIISTGGYGSNKELLKKYCPSYLDGMEYHGVANTGDGFLMATEIGAGVENVGTMLPRGTAGPDIDTSEDSEPRKRRGDCPARCSCLGAQPDVGEQKGQTICGRGCRRPV